LGNLINNIYAWSIGAIALLTVVMLMVAGFQWLLAAGNATKIQQAKTRMISALIALLLVLGAYTILHFVNPELVIFRELTPEKIEEVVLAEPCDITGGEIQLDDARAEESCANTCGAGEYFFRDASGKEEGPWCCKCKGCPTDTVELPEGYEDCGSYCSSQKMLGGYYSPAYPECCCCTTACISHQTECEVIENPLGQDDCSIDDHGNSLHGCDTIRVGGTPIKDSFVCRFDEGKCVWKPKLYCGNLKIDGVYAYLKKNCQGGGSACWTGDSPRDCKALGERYCTDSEIAAEGIDAICCCTELGTCKCIYKSVRYW